MKHLKYIIGTLAFGMLFFLHSCQNEDIPFGDITAPSNIQLKVTYLDDTNGDGTLDETSAPGLGSGTVQLTATADNATAFHLVIEGVTALQKGSYEKVFSKLGDNTYPITVIAYGTGGASSSKTFNIDVLSLYEPPADLLEMLYGSGTRTWRIDADVKNHFGLGPAGGPNPFEYYGANPHDKDGVGMYDDRYTFNEDGTFTHVTNGDVFGRDGLIQELAGNAGGTVNGADIENYPYNDYSENWSLSAPGGVETITLSGLGFIGYYVGGNHKYQILERTANTMTIKTTDGNGQFDWGFKLIAVD